MANIAEQISLREKVLSFEAELSSGLSILEIIDREMNALCDMRSSWVTQVSGVGEIEVQTFKNRVETLRKKAETALMDIEIDKIKLEGFYEAQQLKHLIVATRPRDDGETDKQRSKEIDAVISEGMAAIAKAVKKSTRLRQDILSNCEDMNRQLFLLKKEHQDGHKARIQTGIQRVVEYVDHLSNMISDCESKNKRLTNDYLILRHNARVAKEVLVRSQNEANRMRKILQDNIDKLMIESVVQRERVEQSSAEELKTLTNNIRRQVIEKEREYEDINLRVRRKKIFVKNSLKEHRVLVKKYEDKYEALQKKRKTEIRLVSGELRRLREMIAELELKVHKKSGTFTVNQVTQLLESLNLP